MIVEVIERFDFFNGMFNKRRWSSLLHSSVMLRKLVWRVARSTRDIGRLNGKPNLLLGADDVGPSILFVSI